MGPGWDPVPWGADLVDTSSGAIVPDAKIAVAPGFQVPFAEAIRKETGIATGAVGLITEAAQAEAVLQEGKADLVLLARQFLREPYFPLRAAEALGCAEEAEKAGAIHYAPQYARGKPAKPRPASGGKGAGGAAAVSAGPSRA